MTPGTRSVLFGAHQFLIHPLCLARAWWRLYGFPWDPRLWLCFFVHDIGYLGKPNIDGPEGETHPYLGARIVLWVTGSLYFRDLCLFHSRHLCKKLAATPSRLCIADKLAFVCTPRWVYLFSTAVTGELTEYMDNGRRAKSPPCTAHELWCLRSGVPSFWHHGLRGYMLRWVARHRKHGEAQWAQLAHAHRARNCGPGGPRISLN